MHMQKKCTKKFYFLGQKMIFGCISEKLQFWCKNFENMIIHYGKFQIKHSKKNLISRKQLSRLWITGLETRIIMEYAQTHYLRQSHAWLIQSIELQDLYLSSKSKVDPSLLCTRPWDNIDLKAGKKKKKKKDIAAQGADIDLKLYLCCSCMYSLRFSLGKRCQEN